MATARWGSDVSTSRPSSPLPDSILRLDFSRNLPSGLSARPSPEPHPSLASCFPFSQPLLRPHNHHGTGTLAGALLRRAGPETGSRKWGCEDVFRGSRRPVGRRHGATIPTNAQVRAALGSGLGSARAVAPGARGSGDCHCGGFRSGCSASLRP